MMRKIFNFFAFGMLLCTLSGNLSFGQHSIVFPQPQYLVPSANTFEHNSVLILPFSTESNAILKVFAPQFRDLHGIELKIGEKSNISLNKGVSEKRGFHKITVNEKGIEIGYNDLEGLNYAMQTLLQLTNRLNVTGCHLEDYPAFNYRGVHLDCARHFFTISEIKQFIDELARLKFNTFHWHLTDDQGWRIEIKKYPKLTQISSQRAQTVIGNYHDRTPQQYDNTPYGGFYTQEQIKDVLKYAEARYITVVPEIEMPGHAQAALAAYPELSCDA